MVFRRGRRQTHGARPRHGPAAIFAAICALGVRALLSLAIIAAVAVGLLYLRLSQGPIHLPVLARLAAEEANAGLTGVRVEIADAVLRLGSGQTPSGLSFLGVRIRDEGGDPLFIVPQIAARLPAGDLLTGRIAPSRITLIDARARLTRDPDGTLRFGIGAGTGVVLAGPGETPAAEPAALRTALDRLLGEEPLYAELTQIERIDVADADLVYDDRLTGRYWHAPRAAATLWRLPGGLRLAATVELDGDGVAAPAARLAIDRRIGDDRTDLRLALDDLTPGLLAGQLPELAPLQSLGTAVDAEISATLSGGRMIALDGVVSAPGAVVELPGGPTRLSEGRIAFRFDPGASRLRLEEIALAAPGLSVRADGVFDLGLTAAGGFASATGDVNLARLELDLPGRFAEPVVVRHGQGALRWRSDRRTIELVDGVIEGDDFRFELDGRVALTGQGPLVDLRTGAEGISIDRVMSLWPRGLAENARRWMVDNIHAARFDTMTAQLRLGAGAPQFALDFTYSDLVASYLGDFPPITDATGRASLTAHRLSLAMRAGEVAVPEQGVLRLDGSDMVISAFSGEVTPADIQLRGEGPLPAVLTLIDRAPLRLASRVGLDTQGIGGQARANVTLAFPLINDLPIERVEVDARAQIDDLQMPLTLSGQRLDIRAQSVALRADGRQMQVSGRAAVDGVPVDIDWTERYGGGAASRSVDLRGTLDARLRERLGIAELPVTGKIPFTAEVEQQAGGAAAFEVDADLGPADVTIAALGWQKAPGRKARLRIAGKAGARLGIDRFDFEGPGLSATGTLTLSPGGGLARARIDRLRLADEADVTAEVVPSPDGAMQVMLSGRYLDLSRQLEAEGGQDESGPIEIGFDLEELRVGKDISLTGARGRFRRGPDGSESGEFSGKLGGVAPVEGSIEREPGARGFVRLDSPDAGAVLAAAGVYRGGSGGRLTLEATLGAPGEPDLEGRLLMTDTKMQSRATLQNLLDQGGLADPAKSVEAGGVTFRKIRIPFVMEDGRIRLTDAVALSSILSITARGVVDRDADNVDIDGVISPAYGLTGALDEIPVLGELLTGGKGEGILAMTFTLSGPLEDPQVAVNPLSLLTPGFLRNIFRGGPGDPERLQDFQQRIRRSN